MKSHGLEGSSTCPIGWKDDLYEFSKEAEKVFIFLTSVSPDPASLFFSLFTGGGEQVGTNKGQAIRTAPPGLLVPFFRKQHADGDKEDCYAACQSNGRYGWEKSSEFFIACCSKGYLAAQFVKEKGSLE